MRKLLFTLMALFVAFAANATTLYLVGGGTVDGKSLGGSPNGNCLAIESEGNVVTFTVKGVSWLKISDTNATSWATFNKNGFTINGKGDYAIKASELGQKFNLWWSNGSSEGTNNINPPSTDEYIYTITLGNKGSSNTTLEVTAKGDVEIPPAQIYARGLGGNWDNLNSSIELTTADGNIYTLSGVTIDTKFKIADGSWGAINYGYNGQLPFNQTTKLTYNAGDIDVAGQPITEATITFNLNDETILVTGKASGSTEVDPFAGWYVNLGGEFNGNDFYTGGVQPVDGIATFTNQAIGNKGFKIKVWEGGGDDKYYIADGPQSIPTDEWVQFASDAYDAQVYIKNAPANGVYTVQYNVENNTIYVEQTAGDDPVSDIPENLYLIGTLNEAGTWSPEGNAFENEGDNMFSIENVAIYPSAGAEVGYFGFSGATSAPGADDWDTVNGARYGALTKDEPIDASEGEVETTFIRGTNAWSLEPGIYNLYVGFDEMSLTVEYVDKLPEKEPEIPTTLYAIGNIGSATFSYDNNVALSQYATGSFTGENLNLVASENGKAYLQFCTAMPTSENSPWDNLGTRFGATTENASVEIPAGKDQVTLDLGSNGGATYSFQLEPGYWDVDVKAASRTVTFSKKLAWIALPTTPEGQMNPDAMLQLAANPAGEGFVYTGTVEIPNGEYFLIQDNQGKAAGAVEGDDNEDQQTFNIRFFGPQKDDVTMTFTESDKSFNYATDVTTNKWVMNNGGPLTLKVTLTQTMPLTTTFEYVSGEIIAPKGPEVDYQPLFIGTAAGVPGTCTVSADDVELTYDAATGKYSGSRMIANANGTEYPRSFKFYTADKAGGVVKNFYGSGATSEWTATNFKFTSESEVVELPMTETDASIKYAMWSLFIYSNANKGFPEDSEAYKNHYGEVFFLVDLEAKTFQVSMSPFEEEIPVEVNLEATNTTMTHESVNIQYSIFTDIEEDNISYQLFVTGNGVDYNTTVESASGEITVPGLKGNTAYTLEVTAQVTVSNQAYSSNAVTLEFTTPADPLVSYLGVDTSGAWPSTYNVDYPIFSENKGQSYEGTYTFQPGTSFNIWYATNVAFGDKVTNVMPFGPIDSDYDGVEEFLNFSADVTELTFTSVQLAMDPGRWTLQGDKELELHILFDVAGRKVVITNLTEIEAPAPEVTLQPGPISQGGNENVNQSGTIDNEAKTINMQTSKAYAYVYLEGVPEGATVWYKLEDVTSTTGIMLMALEGYQKAEYVEYTTDDDGNPAGDKEWRIPLASNSAGELDVYYELANGQNTTPATYFFMVTKTTPTGVDGINADEDGAEYFTLQGVKVQNPERGIYIRVINGKAEKVVL